MLETRQVAGPIHFSAFVALTLVIAASGLPSGLAEDLTRDITDRLSAQASIEATVDHLIEARKSASATRGLALQLKDLTRDHAYEIQMALLRRLEADGEKLIGWKLGGTYTADPQVEPDPLFGFILASDVYQSGSKIPARKFSQDVTFVEAEIGYWIGKDLPGPEVSRESLEAAIQGVGGSCELISVRVRAADGRRQAPTELAICDGVAHGGVLLPSRVVPLGKVVLADEVGSVRINGAEVSQGSAANIMNGDGLAAVLFLANELPKRGRLLRAGDFVVSGSMLIAPQASPGDRVEIRFSTFGPLGFSLK